MLLHFVKLSYQATSDTLAPLSEIAPLHSYFNFMKGFNVYFRVRMADVIVKPVNILLESFTGVLGII